MGGKPRLGAVREGAAGAGNRNISVSEFFSKNRHLLGFDSAQRALLTAVKEAVDNSLDACEEADLLPELWVEIEEFDAGIYRVAVEDNGPGIGDDQISRIFGKLLYGSKFHRLSQSRGQQGMGISAAGMYAQLTTGLPVRILTRRARRELAREVSVTIDMARNRPAIHSSGSVPWHRTHGTRVEMTMEGQYQHGQHSIPLYLKLTAVANPHASLHLREPDGTEISWERTARHKPPRARTIKPHPHGVELGQLISMLRSSPARHLGQFLREEFSQVGARRAQEIVDRAGQRISLRSPTRRLARDKVRALHRAIAATEISAPPSDCVVPIGEAGLLEGLAHEVPARFSTAVTRKPAVYRGNPFVIEIGLAYGHQQGSRVAVTVDGRIQREGGDLRPESSEPARVLRFANRVPLLYQQSHCAMTAAVKRVNWRRYGLEKSNSGLPRGPLTLLIHIASVWVPFTSESKEAIASYAEIDREIELGLHECGRRLASVLRRERALEHELSQRETIERYLPHVGDALRSILGWSEEDRAKAIEDMDEIVHHSRRTP